VTRIIPKVQSYFVKVERDIMDSQATKQAPPKKKASLYLRIYRASVLVGLPKLVLAVTLLGIGAALFLSLGDDVMRIASAMLLFGLWSLGCVLFGQFLEYKRHTLASPLPRFDDQAVADMLTQGMAQETDQDVDPADQALEQPWKL
jgi:hypothetical protein